MPLEIFLLSWGFLGGLTVGVAGGYIWRKRVDRRAWRIMVLGKRSGTRVRGLSGNI